MGSELRCGQWGPWPPEGGPSHGACGSAHSRALETDTQTWDTEGQSLPVAASASPLAVILGSRCDFFSTQPFLSRAARITG